MGCNEAISQYSAQLRNEVKLPIAPALVADSLSSTSLWLEWNFPNFIKLGLNVSLQWKYEHSNEWQYYNNNNNTWTNQNTIFVENLKPYTKYKVSKKNYLACNINIRYFVLVSCRFDSSTTFQADCVCGKCCYKYFAIGITFKSATFCTNGTC